MVHVSLLLPAQRHRLVLCGTPRRGNSLGTKLIGTTFRPCEATSLSNPAIEAGDILHMTDKSGNSYRTFVTKAEFSVGESETYYASAESKEENQSQRFSKADKAQAAADKAQQTADETSAGVEEAKTEITQLNGQITLKADKGKLIAEINISPETIKISADKLELNGLVKISNLRNGDTTIDGACISTGRIEANDGSWWLDLDSGRFYLSGGTFKGDLRLPGGAEITGPECGEASGMFLNGSEIQIGGYQGSMQTGNVSVKGNLGVTRDLYVEGDLSMLGDLSMDGDLSINGQTGETHDVKVMGAGGDKVGLSFKNGLFTGTY